MATYVAKRSRRDRRGPDSYEAVSASVDNNDLKLRVSVNAGKASSIVSSQSERERSMKQHRDKRRRTARATSPETPDDSPTKSFFAHPQPTLSSVQERYTATASDDSVPRAYLRCGNCGVMLPRCSITLHASTCKAPDGRTRKRLIQIHTTENKKQANQQRGDNAVSDEEESEFFFGHAAACLSQLSNWGTFEKYLQTHRRDMPERPHRKVIKPCGNRKFWLPARKYCAVPARKLLREKETKERHEANIKKQQVKILDFKRARKPRQADQTESDASESVLDDGAKQKTAEFKPASASVALSSHGTAGTQTTNEKYPKRSLVPLLSLPLGDIDADMQAFHA
eukprot:m.85445 g.85445  ORF g.85445 m.85445 type:complete len:340 (-) comp25871_c0_seq1:49-1068(-)